MVYKVEQRIAILGERADVSKELNLISYNGHAAKYDIRGWKHLGDKLQMMKGVTLNTDEIIKLRDALNRLELN